MKKNTTNCLRCKVKCQVSSAKNPDAKMLRRSKEPKGFCVNCAVHNWLRNTYPVNMLLAQSGPQSLAYPHIQEQFAGIMRSQMADAMPDEIGWDLIVENWDLPFPHKIKPSATNPCSQLELEEVAAGTHPGLGSKLRDESGKLKGDHLCITSFDQMNELEPGLDDELRDLLRAE